MALKRTMTVRPGANYARPQAPARPRGQAMIQNEFHATTQTPQESYLNTPQFPGWQKGNTRKETQDFIKDQARRKGFVFSGGTAPKDFKLEISGSARFLYGLAFQNIIGTVSLMINNEQVFENVSTAFLQFGATNQDYYAINRPLSGQDSVTITITGFAGYSNEQMQIVYK